MAYISLEELFGFTITTGEVFNSNDYILAVTNDSRLSADPEDDHSYFVRYINSDIWIDDAWPIRSQARSTSNPQQIMSVSPKGNVRLLDQAKGGKDEPGIFGKDTISGKPIINEVVCLADNFYTIGTRRAIYMRSSPGVWENIGNGCYDEKAFGKEFNGLTSTRNNNLYAVGADGEIWCFKGQWSQEESGTTLDLNTCCTTEDDTVYAAGSEGIILCGKDGLWQKVGEPKTHFEYWSMLEYKNEIYLTANLSFILKLDKKDGSVHPVKHGDGHTPSSAYHLKVRDGILYCFGPKDICCFDGQNWEVVLSL